MSSARRDGHAGRKTDGGPDRGAEPSTLLIAMIQMPGHSMQRKSSTSRIVELDAMRGLAALAVVMFHYTTFYDSQVGHTNPLPLEFPAGNYGVHLFFLISGFVIFMTLERTRGSADFVVSRFSRLFPAYWMAIVATSLVVAAIGMPWQRVSATDLLLNLTMVQQFLGAEHVDGSYWTLQVELFFYAQMLLWHALGQLKRIRWIIVGWLLLAVIQGEVDKHGGHFSYTLRELLILRHIPFFALGILFYRIHSGAPRRAFDYLTMGLCLLAIGIAEPPVFLLVATICCALFALVVSGRLGWLASPPFLMLGGMSYSIYLLHQAIGLAIIHRLEQAGMHSLPAVASAILVVLLLAAALSRLGERPALAWIRNGWKRRTDAVVLHGA
jgi:peptidoglycan/LPS O-acetylase OafA/YrhL